MNKLTIQMGVVALCLVALASCVSTYKAPDGSTVQRSAYEMAELSYGQTSIGYTAIMLSLQDASRVGLITKAQWESVVDPLQDKVQKYQPLVRGALDVWRVTGKKPESYDDALAKLTVALTELQTIFARSH